MAATKRSGPGKASNLSMPSHSRGLADLIMFGDDNFAWLDLCVARSVSLHILQYPMPKQDIYIFRTCDNDLLISKDWSIIVREDTMHKDLLNMTCIYSFSLLQH